MATAREIKYEIRADTRPALIELDRLRRSLSSLSEDAKREGIKLEIDLNVSIGRPDSE